MVYYVTPAPTVDIVVSKVTGRICYKIVATIQSDTIMRLHAYLHASLGNLNELL